jgi:RHS repeat-associated protein
VSGAVKTNYLLDGFYEKPPSGPLSLADVSGPAGDLAHYAGAAISTQPVGFLYYSGHGDLAAEASLAGTRTADFSYDPFGAPLQAPPENATSERWTGRFDKKLDSVTSLIEMGARPYDPALGRFLAVDPVDGGSLNGYEYAGQDPINEYDLDGRCLFRGDGGCGGGWLIAAARGVGGAIGRAASGIAAGLPRGFGIRIGARMPRGYARRVQGFDSHAINRIMGGRGDGGVSDRALLDAIKHPLEVIRQVNRVLIKGKHAMFSIDRNGIIRTAIPRGRAGRRFES